MEIEKKKKMGFLLWHSVTVLSRFLRAESASLQDELHLLRYCGLCKFATS